MVKRTKSELRTNAIPMSVHKYGNLQFLQAGAKQYWGISHMQPFFPSLEKLFKTDNLESPADYGIRFKDEISAIPSASSIRTQTGEVVQVHKKVSMILAPFKCMRGSYGHHLALPKLIEQSMGTQEKLQNPNNSSYVGSIISAVLSESGCVHFPKVYGVFNGIAETHKIDISDDYEEVSERPWFSANIGKTFELNLSNKVTSQSFTHTRKARIGVQLGEEVLLEGVEEVQAPTIGNVESHQLEQIFGESDAQDNESDGTSVSTSYIFDVKSCDCESDEEEDVSMEESADEPFAWAEFSNVPVQVTVMEKCDGTIYELMMKNPEPEKHLAWVTQVIFALAFAQRNFGFIHNDLHANNVMYVPCTKEYLYYNVSGTTYRVPTFGYIIKLIDFERSIASFKITGMKDPKFFMSDHYDVNEEAGGQYNFEPYFMPKYPVVKPNPSFDLARFATSMFWDLFPEGPTYEGYNTNPLFAMLVRWMKTDESNSVLFGKKDATHDRYHGFQLYKAIARFCKDAVPNKEVGLLKSLYGMTNIPNGESICVIDA